MHFSPHLLWIIPFFMCHGVEGSSLLSKQPLAKIIADIIRILLRVTRPYSDTVLDVIYFLFMGRTKQLPPIYNKLLLMPATELAEKIRKRQITSEEVVQAYVERSKSVHPCINAVVDERYEDALKDARDVDSFLENSSKSEEEIAKETPLLGLPFSCKEAMGVKGMAQTAGLARAKDRKAPADSDAAALYRKAGAIPVTVTNVPEQVTWWESDNHVFGRTRNPYDNRRTAGGSSGGEASLITSAGALFGIGNDIDGSIRLPASFNGIYGHKPSRGVVSNFGDFPYSYMEPYPNDRTLDFVSTGPMCRYAQDLQLLLKVLADNDTRIQLDKKVDFRRLKVYYMEEMPGYLEAAVPEVKNAISKALCHFQKKYGIKPIKLTADELLYATPIWESKMLEYGSPPFVSLLAGKNGRINLYIELIKNILGYSTHTLPSIYQGMVEERHKGVFYHKNLLKYQELERKINDTLEKEDAILLVPTHPEPPPHHLMTIPNLPNIGYTSIFNILGLPSTQIPAGLSSKGLPFGIQAVSGRFKDHLTLATAVELDKVYKGWRSPGPIRVCDNTFERIFSSVIKKAILKFIKSHFKSQKFLRLTSD